MGLLWFIMGLLWVYYGFIMVYYGLLWVYYGFIMDLRAFKTQKTDGWMDGVTNIRAIGKHAATAAVLM